MNRRTIPGRASALLLLLAALLAAPSPAAEPGDARGRILELLRDGEREAALPLCRAYVVDHPDDDAMLYNLACLEATAGRSGPALAALRRALDLRVEALDGAADDPDLASLRGDPAFDALLAEHRGRLALLASERGADLQPDRPGRPLSLHGDGPPDAAQLRLTWEPLGLVVELTARGPWTALTAAEAYPPWHGGPALVLTLAVPGEDPRWLSGNAWVLVFGMEKDAPVGALWVASQERWQRVLELDPKVHVADEDELVMRTTVPWSTILPFHPLVDPVLGLNAALRVPAPGGDGYLVAELLPDPARFAPTAPVRRVVPLAFDPAGYPQEAFLGRLDDSIARGAPLGVELVAVARESGRGHATLDVLDTRRNSVVPGGAQAGGLEVDPGANRVARELDFTGLQPGAYLVRARFEFPSGRDAEWSTQVLNLPPGWADALEARVADLRPRERPTARHLLDAVRAAAAAHVPRRHPGALAVTLDDLRTMLDRADETGTVLPRDGVFVLVGEGPDGGERLVSGFLPAAPEGQPRLPVLVLSDQRGLEDRFVARLARFYEHERPARGPDRAPPLFLVPHLVAAPERAGDTVLAEAEAALAWTRDHFGVDRVALAGVGTSAGAALRLAAAHPDKVARLAVMAGKDLEPWPLADDAFVADRLAGLLPDLPVAWYDFVDETSALGQGPQVRRVLDRLGLADVADVTVRGGLNLTQAADRLALWAEGDAGAR